MGARDIKIAYLFVLPAFSFFVLWWFIPTFYSAFLSFYEWDFISPEKRWVGVSNYIDLATSSEFHDVLGATFYFTLGSVVLSLVGGLILAVIVNRKLSGIGVFRSLIFSPWVTPIVAVSLIWMWIYDPQVGFANWVLQALSLPKLKWLQSRTWAMPAVIIFSSWKFVGYNMVYFLAGLQSIPQELYEAAEMDGASKWSQFRHITLPLLSPMTFFLLLISCFQAINAFDQIQVMTQGGPARATTTLVYYLYKYGFRFFEMGYASAVAVITLMIALLFTFTQFRLSRRWVYY